MNFDLVQFYGDWQTILPEAFLTVWACVITFMAVMGGETSKTRTGTFAVWTLIGTVITAAWVAVTSDGAAFGGTFVFDRMGLLFKELILGGVILTAMSSIGPVNRLQAHRGEYFGILLFSAVGMMMMVSSTELLTLYIGLELATIPLFVLAAFDKTNRKSAEAGLKYVILGGISSAVLLYGVALIYGMTGQTDLTVLKTAVAQVFMVNDGFPPAMALALIFLLAGFGFKLSLAPFHMWAPDVYEGAPTPITAYLSVASKAAAIAAFMRVFFVGLESSQLIWTEAIAALAALAMIVGNVTAIVQTNIKRMLAYSSVAQIGYIMVGAVAVNTYGAASMTYYAMAYLFANMGAFICVIAFSDHTGSDEITDYTSLARRSPVIASFLSLFLISLAGIPPTAGFMAKYYVFLAAIRSGYLWLVVVGLLTSVVALYYYATIIRKMFFPLDQPEGGFPLGKILLAALSISAIGVLLLGIFPGPFVDFAKAAAAILMPGS